MASETRSIFLYGKPTKVKLKMLSEIQMMYTNKINEFIDLMISDSSYKNDAREPRGLAPWMNGVKWGIIEVKGLLFTSIFYNPKVIKCN